MVALDVVLWDGAVVLDSLLGQEVCGQSDRIDGVRINK